MKMSYIKYLLFIVCGVVGCGSLFTSCQMEDLGPIPAEELYLRNFIKQYGLIDPNQDWNLAERSTVTVTTDYAKEVNVYVKIDGRYFRVAFYAEVSGDVTIPVDIPEGTDALYVEIDKKLYQTVPGGTVDANTNRWSMKSRDGETYGSCLKISTVAGDELYRNQIFIAFDPANISTNSDSYEDGDDWSISLDARTEDALPSNIYLSALKEGWGYLGELGTWNNPFAPTGAWSTFTESGKVNFTAEKPKKNSGNYFKGFVLSLGNVATTIYIDNIVLTRTHNGATTTHNLTFDSESDYAYVKVVVNDDDGDGENGGPHTGDWSIVTSSLIVDYEEDKGISTGGGSDPTPSTPTADDTGIVSQVWYIEGTGMKNQIEGEDDFPISKLELSKYFYKPDEHDRQYYIDNSVKLSDLPKATDQANAMVMNTSNPFAYAQLYTPGSKPKIKVSFDANVPSGASAYFKLNHANFPDGVVINQSKRYEITSTSDFSAEAWIQMAFKAVSGNVTISNMSFEYLDVANDDEDPGVENAGDMAWIIAGEDLGATDDFDFNDVIIRIESIAINSAALRLISKQWQVVEDNDDHHTLSRAADDHVYTRLKITSMCAGGILDSYLHFHNGTTDYVLMPGGSPEEPINLTPTTTPGIKLAGPSTSEADYEWHKWFTGDNGSEENNRLMLNTGHNSVRTPKSVTMLVPNTFSMSNYSRTFRDYGMGTGNTIDNFFTEDGKFIYDNQDHFNESWTYDKNDRIYGFYMTVGHYDPTNVKCQNIIRAPYKGRAPFMFLIPDVGHHVAFWRWAWECVSITDVYPNFKKWVTNAGNYTWYLDEPQTNQKTKEERDVPVPYILRDSSTGYPSYN